MTNNELQNDNLQEDWSLDKMILAHKKGDMKNALICYKQGLTIEDEKIKVQLLSSMT